MKHASRSLADQAVTVALVVLLVALSLFLSAYLDGQPSETDALQLSADVSNQLAAEFAAQEGPR